MTKNNLVYCPNCGSDATYPARQTSDNKEWHCAKCHWEWVED